MDGAPIVKQSRVLHRVAVNGALSFALLWFVRGELASLLAAVAYGVVAGALFGGVYWWQLRRKIARRDRRFERNKIFVTYVSIWEIALTAVAYGHYLAAAIAGMLIVFFLVDHFSAHWWTVFVGSGGLTTAIVLGVEVWLEERKTGPLYYQYSSRHWQGAEGMLYQVGEVVRPLEPLGMVRVRGELWRAVSASGDHVSVGERVEVLSIDGLTLTVDPVVPGAPEE